jgi:hypothetical protein
MRRLLFILTAFLTFLPALTSNASAQNEKINFVASWKQNTDKAIIEITISKGEAPFNCYVYDDSPFKGGKLIAKNENISDSKFGVELGSKTKVYICLVGKDMQIATQWLTIDNNK